MTKKKHHIVKKNISPHHEHEDKEPIHVRLEYSNSLRKSILRCTIDSTHMLKSLEEIRGIKERKEKLLERFHTTYSNIKSLVKELNKDLPSLPPEPKKEEPILVKEEIHKEQKIEPIKSKIEEPQDEISMLKKELAEIESKLKEI
ncbi:hypothetical protein J4216_00900 [Candidatus Woesearchaeota archaeon]|nr:hypothetical protein [Candidatus Woesearchaeota archaeon]